MISSLHLSLFQINNHWFLYCLLLGLLFYKVIAIWIRDLSEIEFCVQCEESRYVVSCMCIQMFKHILVKRLSLPYHTTDTLSEIKWSFMWVFFYIHSFVLLVILSTIELIPYCFNYMIDFVLSFSLSRLPCLLLVLCISIQILKSSSQFQQKKRENTDFYLDDIIHTQI